MPQWMQSLIEPQCEICPSHATCYSELEVSCDNGFVQQPHPYSLWGLIPRPPRCKASSGRALQVSILARQIVDTLREEAMRQICGHDPTAHGDVSYLESDVKARLREQNTVEDAEYNSLWGDAVLEAVSQRELAHSGQGPSSALSLVSVPSTREHLWCMLRRFFNFEFTKYSGHFLMIYLIIQIHSLKKVVGELHLKKSARLLKHD
ncbi:hypothetical protein EYZ11_011656 [Aspergillus tanneri]|uniref:Man1/Src1-like C-terminal domain-containing protein n=1 Tax=Aspergillus tanneri TaxID=1220188 RepID=A0A4S3J286_9EURO|nr:hypothetical protein EYZ11_011656 [Aspergillus tanneri]